jgi:hypothetical protein
VRVLVGMPSAMYNLPVLSRSELTCIHVGVFPPTHNWAKICKILSGQKEASPYSGLINALMMLTLHNIYLFPADCYMSYSVIFGSRAYIKECCSGLALSRLHHLVKARAPVKTKKEEQDANHSIHCEQ